MPQFDKQFLEEGRTIWEKRAGRPLTLSEIDEAARNLVGYFDLLARWSAEEAKVTSTQGTDHPKMIQQATDYEHEEEEANECVGSEVC